MTRSYCIVVIVVVSTYGEDAGHAAPRCGMDFVREAFLVGKNTIALVLFWIFLQWYNSYLQLLGTSLII